MQGLGFSSGFWGFGFGILGLEIEGLGLWILEIEGF